MLHRFETFTVQLAKIRRYIQKIKSEEMAEFGLKGPHVTCLYYLYKSPKSLTAKELCDVCDEDKAAISRSIEFLEDKGYLEVNSKTEKRYRSPLALTESGKGIAKIVAEKIDNVVNLASEGLSSAKRKEFYDTLILISNNLQQICDKY